MDNSAPLGATMIIMELSETANDGRLRCWTSRTDEQSKGDDIMIITAKYQNGIDKDKDQVAFDIAKRYDANLIGSGCWLQEPFERDLQWSVNGHLVAEMAAGLRMADFAVHVGD